jgi:hypothetical protein
VSRFALTRLTCPQIVHLGPGLLALGLAAALVGCSDDTPRAGSADLSTSRKAAAARGGGLLDFGKRSADIAPVRTRGKGTTGRLDDPAVKTQGKTR